MSKNLVAIGCLAIIGAVSSVRGQQVTVTAPRHNVQESFFERNGVNFGFNIRGSGPNAGGTRVMGLSPDGQLTPNIQFRQGSFGASQPTVGGFDPNKVARTGFAVLGKEGDLFFNFEAGQGSTRTHTMEAPMITLTNGSPGSFSDQIQTPFVTSVTPIVGGFGPGPQFQTGPRVPMALTQPGPSLLMQRLERLRAGEGRISRASRAAAPVEPRPLGAAEHLDAAQRSTAGQPAASIAELTRQRAEAAEAAKQASRELLARAEGAEGDGKLGLAKVYYRMLAKDASGLLKDQAERKLRELSAAGSRGAGPQ